MDRACAHCGAPAVSADVSDRMLRLPETILLAPFWILGMGWWPDRSGYCRACLDRIGFVGLLLWGCVAVLLLLVTYIRLA